MELQLIKASKSNSLQYMLRVVAFFVLVGISNSRFAKDAMQISLQLATYMIISLYRAVKYPLTADSQSCVDTIASHSPRPSSVHAGTRFVDVFASADLKRELASYLAPIGGKHSLALLNKGWNVSLYDVLARDKQRAQNLKDLLHCVLNNDVAKVEELLSRDIELLLLQPDHFARKPIHQTFVPVNALIFIVARNQVDMLERMKPLIARLIDCGFQQQIKMNLHDVNQLQSTLHKYSCSERNFLFRLAGLVGAERSLVKRSYGDELQVLRYKIETPQGGAFPILGRYDGEQLLVEALGIYVNNFKVFNSWFAVMSRGLFFGYADTRSSDNRRQYLYGVFEYIRKKLPAESARAVGQLFLDARTSYHQRLSDWVTDIELARADLVRLKSLIQNRKSRMTHVLDELNTSCDQSMQDRQRVSL